jgi:hypothetical protein
MVSVEFNLLYRWHSTLSAEDTEWTAGEFSKLFEGRDLGKVSPSHCARLSALIELLKTGHRG